MIENQQRSKKLQSQIEELQETEQRLRHERVRSSSSFSSSSTNIYLGWWRFFFHYSGHLLYRKTTISESIAYTASQTIELRFVCKKKKFTHHFDILIPRNLFPIETKQLELEAMKESITNVATEKTHLHRMIDESVEKKRDIILTWKVSTRNSMSEKANTQERRELPPIMD
jgi:hypothetical protein